ncbi:ATP-binding protein [Caballeronia sp. NCTM1]|uniref:ATP-binding protein n=1 Tax=Caballeronia sp. NCTM1 TaxID=2921753 RepID=UPI0020287FEB|nr:ATP-binding protein [Caballeronia sp. NCTM1]
MTAPTTGTCDKHGPFAIKSIAIGECVIRVTRCPSCSKEDAEREAAERAEKERAERQAKIEARLEQAGIPALFRDRSFLNYEYGDVAQANARARFMSFAQNFELHLKRGTVLVGIGKVGTGKSHLACACANYLMARGHTVYFTSTARLFTKIRGTWSRSSEMTEEQMLRQFEQIDLMILDEIGLQRGTEDEQRTLHELLEARRLACKPTILLTNLDHVELAKYLGERFIDRLKESGVSVVFNWESHRKQSRDVAGLDQESA